MNNLHRPRLRQGSFSPTHPPDVDQLSTHPIECRDESSVLFPIPPSPPSHCRAQARRSPHATETQPVTRKNGGKGDGEKTKNTKHKHSVEVGRQVQQKEDGTNLEPTTHKANVQDMEAVVVLALVALERRHRSTDEDWRLGVFG